MESLATIAKETETAKNVFESFQARERFRRETNLLRLQRTLLEDGKKVVPDELIGLFKKLEALGIGTLVIGRGNRLTRFKWHYNLRDVAKAAAADKKVSRASKITGLPAPKTNNPGTLADKQKNQSITMTAGELEQLIEKVLKRAASDLTAARGGK